MAIMRICDVIIKDTRLNINTLVTSVSSDGSRIQYSPFGNRYSVMKNSIRSLEN